MRCKCLRTLKHQVELLDYQLGEGKARNFELEKQLVMLANKIGFVPNLTLVSLLRHVVYVRFKWIPSLIGRSIPSRINDHTKSTTKFAWYYSVINTSIRGFDSNNPTSVWSTISSCDKLVIRSFPEDNIPHLSHPSVLLHPTYDNASILNFVSSHCRFLSRLLLLRCLAWNDGYWSTAYSLRIFIDLLLYWLKKIYDRWWCLAACALISTRIVALSCSCWTLYKVLYDWCEMFSQTVQRIRQITL